MKTSLAMVLSLLVTAQVEAQGLPMASAGAPGAPLQPDAGWAVSLGSGVAGRWGGEPSGSGHAGGSVRIAFGAQADGRWDRGLAQAARLRVRLFTGGDGSPFLPSEGEVEAAYLLGRREFRFVLGRLEATRNPGLALQTLLQASTVPGVEGLVSVAGDQVRIFYGVTPVQATWVWYRGAAHLTRTASAASESAGAEAASAARVRATFLLPPLVLLSAQGDFMRMWGPGDRSQALEGSAGLALLDRTLLLEVLARWEGYTRRSRSVPGTMETANQFTGMASATLLL